MVKTRSKGKTETKGSRSQSSAAIQPNGVKPERSYAMSQGNSTFRGRTNSDTIRQENVAFRTMKSEYNNRVRLAQKAMDPHRTGTSLPICYNNIGPEKTLELRPLGRLPRHIVMILNDHYVQLTKGLTVPEADLYNNGDHPIEQIMPTVLGEAEYMRLIRDVEEEEKQRRMQSQCSSSAVPAIVPYNSEYLVNGEMIGVFVIYGSGKTARAVCSKTKEVFTANVLPRWKVTKVIDVIQRLQSDPSMTADEIRMSELCVSRRLEVIKTNDRWVIFNPLQASTIHSYASDRLDEITEKDVMDIMRKIVEIVRFCHSRKVLVRNFRTRNFYLKKDADGSWIVRPCSLHDMGCEDEVPDSQYARRYVVAAFMAPEMLTAESKRLHSHETEMWGLGVLMYILLTGKYPFHDRDMPQLFRTIKFKQQKWPFNFISLKARSITNNLLRKIPDARMNLNQLHQKLRCTFPDIRCRSTILLKQQDLLVKMDLFQMYYNAYKDRLLPQNVQPIYDEMMSCRKDYPIATEMARNDLRSIHEAIKTRVESKPTGFQTRVRDLRLAQINRVLFNKEVAEAKEDGREADPIELTADDLSKEMLFPAGIYPCNPHYHPSQDPVDWIVYQALRDANALTFPPVLRGHITKIYPAPVYKGVDISNQI